ncbi:MAG TPA: TonB-dependent receptor, partial [Bacteroidetes bacterium]|nr:TonB-dependent receptor [Bacteroidota bacterium]
MTFHGNFAKPLVKEPRLGLKVHKCSLYILYGLCAFDTIPFALFQQDFFFTPRNIFMKSHIYYVWCILIATSGLVQAQNWGMITGRITDNTTLSPLPGATILVSGTDYGTVADKNGRFSLKLPPGQHPLRASFVGYETWQRNIEIEEEKNTSIEISLKPASSTAGDVVVEARSTEAGVQSVTPEMVQAIPAPFKDGFRALKNLPGVMSNNELSNEYSVRGGGYNENLIYINGFEVYKPFRTKQGEQEGLGLLNPDMAERMTLYTGGFPVQYGGKLSSALDVQYRKPRNLAPTGAVYASMLDAGVSFSTGFGKWGLMSSVRRAQARSFFGSQELKGTYAPAFTDAQGLVSYTFKTGHEMTLLGMWARHRFRLEPSQKRSYYGTYNDLRSVWINYSGEENDGYNIGFTGLHFQNRLSSHLKADHRLAYFGITETETYNIRADATLYLVDPSKTDPNSPINDLAFGGVVQEDRADNHLSVGTYTLDGRYTLEQNRHVSTAGWALRQLVWEDHITENSAVIGQNSMGDLVRIPIKNLQDTLPRTTTRQLSAFIQQVRDVLPETGKLTITAGLRADYFDFNNEWTASPRISGTYRLSPNLTLTSAWGIYHQSPAYRELRGETLTDETINGSLNRDLRSQRSIQYVTGATLFLPKRRLYLRGEAYYKKLTNLISYTLQNTRVTYSGENDSEGYTYGLDLQVRGEFVPGLESWFNYGYLVARERFLPTFQNTQNVGWIPRAMDQRHTVSMFVQDGISKDDTWRLYLQVMLGSGLPYTPPTPGESVSNISLQTPGKRHSQRFLEYKRADLGVTKSLEIRPKGITSS